MTYTQLDRQINLLFDRLGPISNFLEKYKSIRKILDITCCMAIST